MEDKPDPKGSPTCVLHCFSEICCPVTVIDIFTNDGREFPRGLQLCLAS